jgi:phosphohistidine phosphatase
VAKLHLLRHAKSSWEGDVPDEERPLAPRGIRAARRVAEHMATRGISPALVLCSSSRRTQETLELLEPALEREAQRVVEEEIYLADADGLLERLRRVPAATPSVLLIGHNPGMQELVLLLAAGPRDEVARVREGLPTAALATLDTGTTAWSRLGPRGARLVELVVPRELD